jgi:hypothetical protein
MWRATRPFVRNPRAQRKVFYDIKAGLLSGFFFAETQPCLNPSNIDLIFVKNPNKQAVPGAVLMI